MFTREDKINRTEAWRKHCRTFASLAGVNNDIYKELTLQRTEKEAKRKELLAQGKAVILDPFVGYIERKNA